MTTREKIEKIVRDDLPNLSLDEHPIDDNAHLWEDLHADSLDVVGIITQIENQFNIDIGDDDAEQLRTFGDLVSYTEGRVGK